MSDNDVIDKKQKLLIEYMIADVEVFAKCYKISKPQYFSPPLDRVMDFILTFFQTHHGIPSLDIIDAETDVRLKKQTFDAVSDMNYFLEEYESYCRDSAMAEAILKAADLVSEGKTHTVEALVREAMLVKMDKSIGISLFDDPYTRITTMSEKVANYSCGIDKIDQMVGMYRKGELNIFYAVTGGGKSLMLGNVGIAMAKQQLDVCAISLELKEELYAKRMDSMLAEQDIATHKDSADIISQKLKEASTNMADITLKKLPQGTTPSQIRAYLLEYSLEKGKYPDVLIVDYIGIMGVDRTRSDNKFDRDEEKAEELRKMAEEFDMIVFSAGQINRDGIDVANVTSAHVAGGVSIVNTSDSSVAIVQTEDDIENNQVQVRALKIRNAEKGSKPVIIYKCPKTLRFGDHPFIKTKVDTSSNPLTKNKTKPKITGEEKGSNKPKSSTKAKLSRALGR